MDCNIYFDVQSVRSGMSKGGRIASIGIGMLEINVGAAASIFWGIGEAVKRGRLGIHCSKHSANKMGYPLITCLSLCLPYVLPESQTPSHQKLGPGRPWAPPGGGPNERGRRTWRFKPGGCDG